MQYMKLQLFCFSGKPQRFQIRGEDQHSAAAAAHGFKRPEHHRGDARAIGGTHSKPRPRTAGHRESASDRSDQVSISLVNHT